MIWNPSKDGAKKLEDLPDEDWSKFLSIKPVVISNPIVLKPHEKGRAL